MKSFHKNDNLTAKKTDSLHVNDRNSLFFNPIVIIKQIQSTLVQQENKFLSLYRHIKPNFDRFNETPHPTYPDNICIIEL